MSLFGFLKDQKLKPTWEYKVDGLIWRVIPAESGKIVGEVRNVTKKATSFFCLNQMTGEVFWEDLKFGERWWIGIEAIHKDVILLHGFADEFILCNKHLHSFIEAKASQLSCFGNS